MTRARQTTRFLYPALSSLLLASLLAHPSRAELRPLTLFEKIGRAPVVVWGEVTDGENRFATIKVSSLIKCTIPERPEETLRIAFRLDSFLRKPWEEKISFATADRVLLFLRKFTKEDGEKPEGDIYTLMWGAQGKLVLPPEGEKAYADAAVAFASILAIQDPAEQERLLRESISSANPLISDGAFQEMIKQGLGDLSMLPEVVAFFDAPREPARVFAMRLLRQLLQDARVAGRAVPSRQDLADRLRGAAVSDPSAAFRAEAVRTLGAIGGEEIKLFLRRLAKEDPSQQVRYEAEKSLLELSLKP